MANTPGLVEREPVLVFLAGLAGVVDAGLITADTLNWVALTNEQTTSLVAFVTAVTALVAGVVRAKVWSPATVAGITAGADPRL